MSISIGSGLSYNPLLNTSNASEKINELEDKLSNINAENSEDEELMDVCKQFEAYLVEQVFKEMKNTIPKSEDEDNKYTEYFGDMMYQKYAENAAESGELGIAQMLYESMKRN